jgi:hypothetical protein
MVMAMSEPNLEPLRESKTIVELNLGETSGRTTRLDGDFLPYEIYLKRQSSEGM